MGQIGEPVSQADLLPLNPVGLTRPQLSFDAVETG
jgi:hypothetical protein